jgi:hypothetical protein
VRGTAVPLSSDAAQGDATLTVTATTGINAGDRMVLKSGALFQGGRGTAGAVQGEIVRVAGVTAPHTLHLDCPIRDSYAVTDGAIACPLTMVKGAGFEGGLMWQSAPTTAGGPGSVGNGFIQLKYCLDAHVDDVSHQGIDQFGVQLESCSGGRVRGGDLRDSFFTADTYYAYGILARGATEDLLIKDMHGYGCQITNGGGSNDGVPRNVRTADSTSTRLPVDGDQVKTGFGIHGDCSLFDFANCLVHDTNTIGFQIKGFDNSWDGCKVHNAAGVGIFALADSDIDYPYQNRIRDCEIIGMVAGPDGSPGHGLVLHGENQFVTNPYIRDCDAYAIDISHTGGSDPTDGGHTIIGGWLENYGRISSAYAGVRMAAGQYETHLQAITFSNDANTDHDIVSDGLYDPTIRIEGCRSATGGNWATPNMDANSQLMVPATFAVHTGAGAPSPHLGLGGDLYLDMSVAGNELETFNSDASDFGGGVGGWIAGANTTIAHFNGVGMSGDQDADGNYCSLQLTAIADGDIFAVGPNHMSGLPVTAGQYYQFAYQARMNDGFPIREALVAVDWYDNTGAYISTDAAGTPADEVPGSWDARPYGDYLAPVGAAYAGVYAQIIGCLAGEVHYIDAVNIWRDANTPSKLYGPKGGTLGAPGFSGWPNPATL